MTRSKKYTKKIRNKKCPYRDTIIIVGGRGPIYWCGLFDDKKECIFKGHKCDAGECSYYLFPERLLKNLIKIGRVIP